MTKLDLKKNVRAKFKTYAEVVSLTDELVDKIPDIRALRRSPAIIFKCAIFAFRTISKDELDASIAEFKRIEAESDFGSNIEVFVNRSYILTLKDVLNKIERVYGHRLHRNDALILALISLRDISETDLKLLIKAVILADLEENFQ